MKRISVWLVGVCTCMFSFLMTSCLNSEETPMHRFAFVTVDNYLGEIVLLWDNYDITLIPSISSLMDYNNFKDVDRAFVTFVLQDGFTDTDKSVWYIDLIASPYYPAPFSIPTKNLSTVQDTLKGDSIINLTGIWADKGYITTVTDRYYNTKAKDLESYLDMVQEGINKDTLFLSMNFNGPTDKKNNVSEAKNFYNSFRLPRKAQLEAQGITTVNDSIVIQLDAKVRSGDSSKIKTEHIKYKLY